MERDRPSDQPTGPEGLTSGDPLGAGPPASADPASAGAGAGPGGGDPQRPEEPVRGPGPQADERRAAPPSPGGATSAFGGAPDAQRGAGWAGPASSGGAPSALGGAPEAQRQAGWSGPASSGRAPSTYGAPLDAQHGDPWTGLAQPGGPPAPAGYGAGPVPPGAWGAQPPGARPVYELASWGRRVGAFLIDGLIVGIVATILLVLVVGAFGGVGFLGGDETGYVGLVLGALIGGLGAFVVSLLYAPLWMARTNGRTLGRQVMGIRVVRANGQPTDFWWSALREAVLKALVFGGLGFGATFGLAWLADVLWPLWDDQNRALHDFIVDSRVVRD